MFEKLKETFSQFVTFTNDEFEIFTSKLILQKVRAKELWQIEGDVSNKIAFINRGILRHYYSKGDDEITAQFYFDSDWVGDFVSYLTRKPAKMNIQALDDCDLLVLPLDQLSNLFARNPFLEKFEHLFSRQKMIELYFREYSFLVESPEQRYLNLVAERPNLIEKIPQYYLAEYLGVRPESLSRIRKRLMQKERS